MPLGKKTRIVLTPELRKELDEYLDHLRLHESIASRSHIKSRGLCTLWWAGLAEWMNLGRPDWEEFHLAILSRPHDPMHMLRPARHDPLGESTYIILTPELSKELDEYLAHIRARENVESLSRIKSRNLRTLWWAGLAEWRNLGRPKWTEFQSAIELKSGTPAAPPRCSKCGLFHLSPRCP